MSQKKDIIKDASVLGIPKMLLLGLQHICLLYTSDAADEL